MNTNLRQLPLAAMHRQLRARMTPYGGWEMPLSYEGQSALDSAQWTRTRASLFDVSHMMQTEFRGSSGTRLLRWLTPADIYGLEVGRSRLCLLLNRSGGILDDAVLGRLGPERFRLVSNASSAAKVTAHISREAAASGLGGHEMIEGMVMLAVQGPEAQQLLSEAIQMPTMEHWKFMQNGIVSWRGCPVLLSRSGYTGEDGFELTLDPRAGLCLAELLLSMGVRMAGLAARDILRIEAGLLLSGQDMTEGSHPGHVGLSWTISKDRLGDYCGSPVPSASRHLFGYASKEPRGPLPRPGMAAVDRDGQRVGTVSSGCYSPSLERNICLVILDGGRRLEGMFLERPDPVRSYGLAQLPFVPHAYKKR